MKLDKRLLTSGIYDAFEHYAGKEHGRESLEAFVQMVERATEERIIKLLDTSRQCTCSASCKTDINVVAFIIEELKLDIIKLIRESN
jgi:hypothetical protein